MRNKHKRSFDILSSFDYFGSSYRNLIKLAVFFFIGLILSAIVTALLAIKLDQNQLLTYGNLIIYPLMFIPAMIYVSANSHANEDFGQGPAMPINRKGSGLWLGFTCAVATFCTAFVLDPISIFLPEMPDNFKAAIEALINGPLWISIICTVIFAPFFEEWLCRGIILRSLLQHDKLHPAFAIIISALAFGFIHANLWQGIPAFLLGALFGFVYYKTGSLTLTMLMHAINNLTSVLISRSAIMKDKEIMYQAFQSHTLYYAVYCACLALLILFIVKLIKTDFNHTAQQEEI